MQTYDIAFARLGQFLPFLHIASVIFFVGFQAGFWFILKYFLKEDSRPRVYKETLKAIRNFGIIIVCFLIMIAITGLFVGVEDNIKSADPMANAILATKYTLAGFLTLNIVYMAYCFKKALKAFENNELIECYENILVVIKYFIPLNLIISLVATYLGVAYRGF